MDYLDTATVTPMLEDSSPAPKKRKLSQSIAEGSSAMAQRAAIMANRDDTFYFDDGSCVLLIESTLFNVSPFAGYLLFFSLEPNAIVVYVGAQEYLIKG